MADAPNADPTIIDLFWEKLSSHLGASSKTVQKIKFGRGAVGKIAVIAVAAIVALGGIGLRLGGISALYAIGGLVAVTLAVLGLIFYIVCKRPELAVMEGAELVMYQHVQLAAKGLALPPPGNPVPPPGTADIVQTDDSPKKPESRDPQ